MATTSKPQVDWDVLTEAYAEGQSDVEIAKHLGITIARFYRLYEDNTAFSEFVDAGRSLAQAWWYEQMRKGLWNKNFNTPLFNFVMKNRYGWADKTETTDTTGQDNLNADQIKTQLSIAMRKLAETNPELFSGVNLTETPIKKGENG